jgi:hypothetical protein
MNCGGTNARVASALLSLKDGHPVVSIALLNGEQFKTDQQPLDPRFSFGSNRKSSMRANIFRFAPKNGHSLKQSALSVSCQLRKLAQTFVC